MYDAEFLAGGENNTTPATQELTKREQELDLNDQKNITWEINHKKIIKVISDTLMVYRGQPPTVSEIANKTGLSRQTVYEHIQDFRSHPVYREGTEMFPMMKFDVLMRLCSNALDGDMKAIRLYLQLMGMLDKKKDK